MKKKLLTVLCAALVLCSHAQAFESNNSGIRPIVKLLFVETVVFALFVLYWNHVTRVDYEYNNGMGKEQRVTVAVVLPLIILWLSLWVAFEYGVFNDSSYQVFVGANILYFVGVFVAFTTIERYAKKKFHDPDE